MKSVVAETAIDFANEQLGVLGEHIADYYCAEHFGWGKQWHAHDKGDHGEWKNGAPSEKVEGKLSNATKLFKFPAMANGTGIDAVWRANSHNEGKPYAIIEAKSGLENVLRTAKNGKKVAIMSKLGVGGTPKLEELLEPPTDDAAQSQATPQSSVQKGKAKKGRKGSTEQSQAPAKAPAGASPVIIVQMSHEWINKNIRKAVAPDISSLFERRGASIYSRHVFFTPLALPCSAQHETAFVQGFANDESKHRYHDIPANYRHQENDVKAAVNRKKEKLRKKYGALASLKAEK